MQKGEHLSLLLWEWPWALEISSFALVENAGASVQGKQLSAIIISDNMIAPIRMRQK